MSEIDLGNGTKYNKVFDHEDKWIGITEWHTNPKTGELCGGFVPFDVESSYLTPHGPKWQVQSYDPLTLSPSILCTACNHHGWIRNGRWEPA